MSTGLWISPSGQMFAVEGGNHMSTVSRNPSKFGYTSAEIDAIYQKYHERRGTEGKAREEILKHCVSMGWVRIRHYPNMYWSISIGDMTGRVKEMLKEWAYRVAHGEFGYHESDKYMPVKISSIHGGDWSYDKLEDVQYMGMLEKSQYRLQWLEHAYLADDWKPLADQVLEMTAACAAAAVGGGGTAPTGGISDLGVIPSPIFGGVFTGKKRKKKRIVIDPKP